MQTRELGATPPLRLTIVNPTSLVSGAERVLLRLADAARDANWDVVVAAADGPLADELANGAVTRVELPDLKAGHLPTVLAGALAPIRALRAARVIRRLAARSDVLVVNGLLALPAVRSARPACPVAWIVHDVVTRPSRRAVVRACGAAVDLAIAISEAVASTVRSIPVRVVRNGTPWPVDPARPDSTRAPIIGQCAGLRPWKGQDVLLEAVARMQRRDVQVELLGEAFPRDCHFAEKLAVRAQQPDLRGRVHMLGHLHDPLARMRTWTIAAHATVAPEPAGLSVLEAMSIGLPIVATDQGGPPEVLGRAGVLVPPGDASALAEALDRLVDDEDLRRACAEEGPRLVAAGLTLEHQLRTLLDVLSTLAQSGGRAHRSGLSRAAL